MARTVTLRIDDDATGEKGIVVVNDYAELVGAARALFEAKGAPLGKCFECGNALTVMCPVCN